MSAKAAIDHIKALNAQHSLRQPWYNDSFSYIDRVVFAILNQKSSGSLSCLLISVRGEVGDVPELDSAQTANAGVYRLSMTVVEAQDLFSKLRDKNYILIVYKYSSFEPWIKELDALPSSTPCADPYDLLAISDFLPECHTYVELFGGGAPLLYARDPSPVEVCNDKGSFVIDFAKALRQTDRFNCFLIMSRIFPFELAPSSVALRRFVQSVPRDDYNVTRSFGWYNMVRSVYAAAYPKLCAEAKEVVFPEEERATISALEKVDSYLPNLHGRLLRVQYENNDYLKIIKTFDSVGTLFWADVPVSIGQQDDTSDLHDTVNALSAASGAVALYVPDKAANLALSQYISEGGLSGWKATKFANSTVYTRNVRKRRS